MFTDIINRTHSTVSISSNSTRYSFNSINLDESSSNLNDSQSNIYKYCNYLLLIFQLFRFK